MTGPDEEPGSALAGWRSAGAVAPVSADPSRHSIHAYFNTSPESPDGRHVLFYASAATDGHLGDIRVADRVNRTERLVAADVTVEDAHRVAAQQWTGGGRYVVYQDERRGRWCVVAVDLATGEERVMAFDRLVGFGQPNGDLVPLYGPHWDPGPHRDLELLHVPTGAVHTAFTAAEVRAADPDWIDREFGSRPISVFFPVLAPGSRRVIIKVSAVASGKVRSADASHREGLFCVDLPSRRITMFSPRWGHPSWHPDGRTLVEVGNTLIDTDSGLVRHLPGLADFGTGHPGARHDGQLLVSDTTLRRFGGEPGHWGVAVGEMGGQGDYAWIHRFDNSDGATSWRSPHPHPVFSPDGQRIYFNISEGGRTRLHVAQAARR